MLAVVVTHDGAAFLGDTIHSLACQRGEHLEIAVVDNASGDGSVAIARAAAGDRPLHVLELEDNLGVPAALNRGLEIAAARSCGWVLLLDQDTTVPPTLLVDLSRGLTAVDQARTGMLVPLARNAFSPDVVLPPLRWDGWRLVPIPATELSRPVLAVDSASTSGSLLRREAAQAVGGFLEELFIDWVDHEFNARLAAAGWEIHCVTGASVDHRLGLERQVAGRNGPVAYRQHQPFRYYYMSRNFLHMHLRLLDRAPGVLPILGEIARHSAQVLRHDSHRAASLWYILRGVVDGLAGRMGRRA